MSNVIDVTDADFEQVVLKADKPVVVDYWATWCKPCKQLSPIMDELATEYGDKAVVVKVDIEQAPDAAAKAGVMSVPTVQVYSGGEVVKSFTGPKPKDKIIDEFSDVIS